MIATLPVSFGVAVPSLLKTTSSHEELFTAFDADKSGAISHDELLRGLNAVGLRTCSEEAVAILRSFDADGNGVLDAMEFRRLVDRLRDFQTQAPQDDITRTFNEFDVDRSNAIEEGELHQALNALGLSTTDMSQARRVLARYDADGNGVLDAMEFRRLVLDLRAYLAGSPARSS